MRDVIRFGKSVTFEDLNPHNFHLKNDYINNILFVGLNVFPMLEAAGYSPKVEQCFISNRYAVSNPHLLKERYSERYTQGLAVRLRISDADTFSIGVDLSRIVSGIKSNVYCYIDTVRKLVEFFFEMPESSRVIEITDEEERRIA